MTWAKLFERPDTWAAWLVQVPIGVLLCAVLAGLFPDSAGFYAALCGVVMIASACGVLRRKMSRAILNTKESK